MDSNREIRLGITVWRYASSLGGAGEDSGWEPLAALPITCIGERKEERRTRDFRGGGRRRENEKRHQSCEVSVPMSIKTLKCRRVSDTAGFSNFFFFIYIFFKLNFPFLFFFL